MSAQIVLLLLAAVAAPPLLWGLARHPVAGCALLIVAVPMTGGLGTSLIPGFRVSEILTVLVATATLLNRLLDREHRPVSGLDITIGAFALGTVLIPSLVLWSSKDSGDLETWRRIVGPLQYLVVYAVFSRSSLTETQQRLVLNLALATSVVVSVIGVLQLADVLGVREFLLQYYPRPGPNPGICEFGSCRPTSVLLHWSSFGAYALMHYTLALALASTPRVGISGQWLGLVLATNAIGVFASETQATVVGLGIATVLVVVHRRRIPPTLAVAAVAGLAGVTALWPEISGRLAAQLESPDSLLVRERYWREFFVPLAAEHPWVGTATVIPTDVPAKLVAFVDNEYLGMMFRAGVIGVGLMAVALASIALVGVRARAHSNPLAQAAGAAVVADVVVLAVMGLTAEYITFGGVSQALWMTVGFLAQAALTRPKRTDTVTILPAWQLPIPSRNAAGVRES